MFGDTIKHNNIIRKYNDAFGELFSNIKLERSTTDRGVVQFQSVPIAFAPRERYESREQQDQEGNRPIAMQLPRLMYDLIDIRYDSSRQLNPLFKQSFFNETNVDQFYNPLPYTLNYELGIRARNIDDMFKIFEQIIVYFTPTLNVKIKLLEESDCLVDMPITLNNVNQMETLEGAYDGKTRELVWKLYFSIPVWIFGQNANAAGNPNVVIRWVKNDLTDNKTMNVKYDTRIELNGTPINEILPTDPYEIVTTIDEGI